MAYRNYSTAVSHIVDATGQGDFTTISAAITAAVSGQTIFIRPGTYTENPTLKAGVNLSAYVCDAFTPNVTINGKCSYTGTGIVTISGINLQTNSDYFLEVTGANASVVIISDSYLNCLNNTGIHFTSSNASSAIAIKKTNGDIGTTGITLFVSTSAGGLGFQYGFFGNSGGSSVISSTSGPIDIKYTAFALGISTSGTATFNAQQSNFAPGNAVAVTHNGSGVDNGCFNCLFLSGSSSAISIGGGATMALVQCTVNSTNGNAITGTGTLNAGIVSFDGSSSTINGTLTVNKIITFGGTIV